MGGNVGMVVETVDLCVKKFDINKKGLYHGMNWHVC